MSAAIKDKKIKDIRVIGTTNSIRDTREGKGSSPCHWRSPGILGWPVEGRRAEGGEGLKSAFYIILIDSERSLSTITAP